MAIEMKIPFIDDINELQKADPKKVRSKQLRQKRIPWKPVIIIFAVLVVILAAVSASTVISEKGKDSNTETSTDLSNTDSTALSKLKEAAPQYINKNILLALTEDGINKLSMLSVLNVNSENNCLSIKYISPEAECTVNNNSGDMNYHLEKGGISELMWAVREYTMLNIDRYICCDQKGFTEIIKELGDFEIDVANEINGDFNGISFIIEEGEHTFDADAMLKYILCLCQTVSSDRETLTAVISQIIQKLSTYQEDFSAVGYFEKFVDYIYTDISTIDISKHSDALEQLLAMGKFDKIVIN